MSSVISASDTLRAESDPVWVRLHQHPFILELAAGTLPLEKFRYFLEQDVFYLEEYARCLAMGAAKSRTADELRYFVADLNNVLDAEIPSNVSLLEKVIGHGAADHGGAHGPAPANVAYASYLHALAMRGGPLDIMAALLPCSWSYVEIATTLLDRTDTTHPVYSEWIAYFSRPQTLDVVSNMRHDFDALALEAATSDARRRDIADAFATSSRLELGFWEMAYTFERWPDETG
jgi:thiaminase/transcriptional activator TenA